MKPPAHSSVRAALLALAMLVAAASGAAGVARAQQTAGPGSGALRVDPTTVIGEVGPFVYGANYGPLGTISVDLFELAADAGINFLRFPGGNWGDLNDIRPFDIDMLMRIAKLMGAEASVQVRLQNGSPEAAAELVRYANIEQDYDIRYWYVGNEPSLLEDYDVERLNHEWRAIAEAMLAVDPDLVLIGPEPHQWNGLPNGTLVDRNGVEWVAGFLEANGDLVDIVAVHRYPFPRSAGDPGTTVADLRENSDEWTDLVERLRTLARSVTGRDDLLFAVTEVNSHWSATIGGEATNDSAFNAIWWADVLGKLIYDGAYMVNYFDLQSSDARGGWGLLSKSGARPSYHVYQLYQEFGDELLAAGSSEPFVSVFAARRDDGKLSVIVTNLNDSGRELDLAFTTSVTVAEARLLDATHEAERVATPTSEAASGEVAAIGLPARSVTLLLLEERE